MTILLQTLASGLLADGASVTLPHALNINGTPQVPDLVVLDTAGFEVTATTTTTITVRNNSGAAGSTNVWLERKHSIPRQVGVAPLSPAPFIASSGEGGGGAAAFPVAAVTDADADVTTGRIYPVDGTSSPTLTLPAGAANGTWVGVHHLAPSTGLVTVAASGGEVFDTGTTTFNVGAGISVVFVANGAGLWLQLTSVFNGNSISAGVNTPFAAIVAGTSLGGVGASVISALNVRDGLNIGPSFAGGIDGPTLAAGTTNDYSPPGLAAASRIFQPINAAGSTIGGLDVSVFGSTDGTVITIVNRSATATLTIAHEGVGSTAPNRFFLPGNVNLAIPANGAKTFQYDGPIERWRVFS
jgi:hypothetical protein